jgi:hypothetical protein
MRDAMDDRIPTYPPRPAAAPAPALREPPVGHDAPHGAADRASTAEALRHTLARVVRARAADDRRRWSARLAPPNAYGADAPSDDLVASLQRLRCMVVDYVAARRAQGLPVEQVLRELKRLVRDAESDLGAPSSAAAATGAEMVRWSIEAYYDEPALRGAPRFY